MSATGRMRAIRGATCVDADTAENIADRTAELVTTLITQNALSTDDVVSVMFSATGDLVADFPAVGARAAGLTGVPLMCCTEMAVPDSLPRVIRVMAHVWTTREPSQLHHPYLHEAAALRAGLPA